MVGLGSGSGSGRARDLPTRRETLNMRDRYQLRLLATRTRFYATLHNLRGLEQRGLIAPTPTTDEEGRVEWTITNAGRAALAEVEP